MNEDMLYLQNTPRKGKSDIPATNEESKEKKQRYCQLCSAHKKYIAVKNHSRYCRYMNEIRAGSHWCERCEVVLNKRHKTADSIKTKRNREKDAVKKLNLHVDEVPPSKITNDDTLFACKIFLRKISKMQHFGKDKKELAQKIIDNTLENGKRDHSIMVWTGAIRNKMIPKILSSEMVRHLNQQRHNYFMNDSELSSDNSRDGESLHQDYDKMSRSDTSESFLQWKTEREMETSTSEFAEKQSEKVANDKDKTAMLLITDEEMETSALGITKTLSESVVSDKDKITMFPNGGSSTWTPPLPALFPSPGRSVDPLKKSASLSSPEATSDKLNKNREIFAKTWQILYDPEYYPMLCKLTIYDWLFLIMKQNIGDRESAFKTIYNSYNESVQLINEYHRSNYNEYYYRLNKYLSSVHQNLSPDQQNLHLPLIRPPLSPENLINPSLVRADIYKEGAPLEPALQSGLPPWQLNMLCSPYPGLDINQLNPAYLSGRDVHQEYGAKSLQWNSINNGWQYNELLRLQNESRKHER